MTRLDAGDEVAVAQNLQQSLVRPVGLEVWTRKQSALVRSDRDPCLHCDDVVELSKQIASLHPGLSITLYDLDKHADRAAEAGIDLPPLTVIRCGGRELRIVGLWAGGLLPTVLDAIVFASAGTTPLQDETRETLDALPEPVRVEVLVAPYDPYSAYMSRLVLSLGVESKNVRVQVTNASEFPLLAKRRAVTEVPLLLLNERRYVGAWEEVDLVEQIRRIAAGEDEPVIRERIPTSPFLTEAEALKAQPEQRSEPTSPGGIILPGR